MPKSMVRSKQTNGARDKNESRSAIEQQKLEGRGRDIYRYLVRMAKPNEVICLNDLDFLHLSFLWLYCDPKRELNVEQFMEMTESEIHARFDKMKTKNHLKILTNFEKVINLYAVEDGEAQVPYRYAL